MGCRIASDGTTLHIEGVGAERLGRCSKIETGESGLLTRLLTPLASHISALNGGAPVEISGHGSILKRNLHEAVAALREAGVHCSAREEGYLPFRIEGGITRREIAFSGRESSQTVSGFLMTLPLLQDATVLTVTEPSSIPYLELTLRTLTRFGIRLDREAFYDGGCGGRKPGTPSKIVFSVPGGQEYRPSDLFLDADWSSAAYFAVAGAVASSLGRIEGITLRNMRLDSLQADEKILDILRSCGADVSVAPADVSVRGDMPGDLQNISVTATGRRLKAFEVDATHCPDLFPILAVLAAHCDEPYRGCRTSDAEGEQPGRNDLCRVPDAGGADRHPGRRDVRYGRAVAWRRCPLAQRPPDCHEPDRRRVVHAGAGAAGRREVHRQVVSFVPRSARPAGVAGRADGISVPAERTLSVRRSAETMGPDD
jgi:5-enolpyruvylshikimate-3-phosphate synthase